MAINYCCICRKCEPTILPLTSKLVPHPTLLMAFLSQNTQNRDSQARHLKLDELIRATKGAHTAVMDSQELTDYELTQIHQAYKSLAEKGRHSLRIGGSDTDEPTVIIDIFNTTIHER
ncbi:MAG: low affinity iron permease family protein [Proteobacteria bacterium]|nr:low affinity iron permease family protein [Pseudomonadota bacterium]